MYGGFIPRKIEPLLGTVWAITEFTKTTFINRQLGIHAKFPMKGVRDSGGEEVEYDMDSAGITTEAGNWYDAFVSSHSE